MINTLFAGSISWIPTASRARAGSFADAFFFSVQTLGGGLRRHVAKERLRQPGGDRWRFRRPCSTSPSPPACCSPDFSADGADHVLRQGGGTAFQRRADADVPRRQPPPQSGGRGRGQRHAWSTTSSRRKARTCAASMTCRVLRSRTPLFVLTWQVIHPIDESSPLFGETHESLLADAGGDRGGDEGNSTRPSPRRSTPGRPTRRRDRLGPPLADIFSRLRRRTPGDRFPTLSRIV